jgi:hypothetical protein
VSFLLRVAGVGTKGVGAPDTAAPTLVSATIPAAGTSISIRFNEVVSIGAGGNGGFAITMSGGAVTLTYSSGDDTDTLVYTTDRTINSDETCSDFDYTQPGNGVEDAAGNDLATFSNQQASVTNNSTQVGASYSAEAEALFAEMSVEPDATRKGHIDTLILALQAAGVWTRCDRIYVLAAHDSQAARLDWKTPGTDTLSATGTTTFTTDQGYLSNGTDGYLANTTNFSSLTQYTRTSAHVSVWVNNNGTATNSVVGSRTGFVITFNPRNGSDQVTYRVNSTAGATTVANADSIGFYTAQRTGASAGKAWKDGVSLGTNTAIDEALPAAVLGIGSVNSAFNGTHRVSFVSLGASMTDDTMASDFYDAVNTYMTAIGNV